MMHLLMTRYGGFYLCKSYVHDSPWLILTDVYYVKKHFRISKFSHASLKKSLVILNEEISIRVNEDEPWKVYNKLYAFVNKKKYHIRTKKELTKWEAE